MVRTRQKNYEKTATAQKSSHTISKEGSAPEKAASESSIATGTDAAMLDVTDIVHPSEGTAKRNHFRHTCYRDSKPRPLLRGWLHGIVSLLLVVALFVSLAYPASLLLETRLQQVGLIVGKLCSYGASAYYHLVDFQSPKWLRWANIIDLVMVPMAIFAIISCGAQQPASCFSLILPPETTGVMLWLCELGLAAFIMMLNGFGVFCQFSTEMPGSADLRSAVVFLYYIYSEVVLYRLSVASSGLNFLDAITKSEQTPLAARLWCATVPLYCTAFGCAKVVDDLRMKECVFFSHHYWKHIRGKWTLHEEFHLLLLLADICAVWSAVAYYQSTQGA